VSPVEEQRKKNGEYIM